MDPKITFTVYVIGNPQGRIYIGQTENLSKRLHQHNDPLNSMSKTTKRFPGPWELKYAETFATRAEAVARERYLKSGQGRSWLKAKLVERAAQ